MKIDTLLAWVGVALGIPGFILLFLNGQASIGFLIALIVMGLLWYQWDTSRPPVTLLEIRKKLIISDDQGRIARVEHFIRARTNTKGVNSYCFKGIFADGSIPLGSIRINGDPPDRTRKLVGQLSVCKDFTPLNRGEIFNLTLQHDVIDSFTQREEVWVHNVSSPTGSIALEISLPQTRGSTDTRAAVGASGSGEEREAFGPPNREQSGRKITLEIPNPKIGCEYHLYWTW